MEKRKENKNKFYRSIKEVLNYTKEYKKWYIISLILMILFILSEIITNTSFSYSLSNVIERNYDKAVYYIIIYILISFLGLNFLHYFHHKISKNVSIEFAKKIRINLYKKILKMSQNDFEKLNVGELFTTIENANEQMISILTKYLWALAKIIYLCVLYVIILFINIYVWILVTIILIALMILTKIYLNKNKKLTDKEYNKTYESSTLLNQTILGFKELKFINSDLTYLEKYKKVNFELYDLKQKKANLWVNVNVIRWDIAKITDLLLIMTLIFLITKFNFDTTKVILLSTYITNIVSIFFTHIIENSIDIPSFVTNIQKNMKILNDDTIKRQKYGNVHLNDIKGVIQFKDVNYKYDKSNFAIKNISFKINPNEKTAIVGNSGAGKTTIFKLLSHYYGDYTGTISIDDIDLKDISEKSFIDNISIVHQEPFIFNLSIKENIMISNPSATNAQFLDACKKAKLDDFVNMMPQKYNTIINDKSTNLSGGQKQRIAIARAILKDAKIILFDEPTSALDNSNARYMKEIIDNFKNKTVIVISHDINFIKDFDKIIHIEKGIIRNITKNS